MSLVPFYMLEGEINLIKEIKFADGIEKHWEDEKGHRAVIINLEGNP